MNKQTTGAFKNPSESPEFRKALLKEIADSNLSPATKAVLTNDVNIDNVQKFAVDAGSKLEELIDGAEARS